ncbi:MAG TPA: hypothetical protein VNV65_00080 [Candidatus Solibacter sp.]|nr:hypothetical protein [Candidatus Solibacter sp.]
MAAFAVSALAGCSSDAATQAAASGDGSVAAAQAGRHLGDSEARALEQRLDSGAVDVHAREELVGYYFLAELRAPAVNPASTDPGAARVARDRHLLWLITNDPQLDLLGTAPDGVVEPAPDATAFAAATAAWSRQAAAHSSVAQVQGNAGVFFAQTHDAQTEPLLKRAESLSPSDVAWPSLLGDFYSYQAQTAPLVSAASAGAAAAALTQIETAWRLAGSVDRDVRLDRLAKLAVVAGDYTKAANYATRLLHAYPPGGGQSPLTYGGAIHDGNMVLGRVAAHQGDIAAAGRYLLAAGATPGSPQLDQLGPNFALARDLLVAGNKSVVLTYFDLVAKFWSDPKLAAWRADVGAGKVPDFGASLWS